MIRAQILHPSDFQLEVTAHAVDHATNREVSTRTRRVSLGPGPFDEETVAAVQHIMADLRQDLAADLRPYASEQVLGRAAEETAQGDKAVMGALHSASLPELLAGIDSSVAVARERNRAIVAASVRQMPGILRGAKSDELTTLMVKVEQTILDLDHEAEVAKDRAQQAAAAGGGSRKIDEGRGLGICYRERIELLKPIVAALREELANRIR